MKGGIYHEIQIDLTYSSNHIEGSKLKHDQTRFIFETKTLGVTDEVVKAEESSVQGKIITATLKKYKKSAENYWKYLSQIMELIGYKQ